MRPSGPRPKGWPEKGRLPCRTGSRGTALEMCRLPFFSRCCSVTRNCALISGSIRKEEKWV